MAIKVLTIDSEYESACRLGYPTHTHLGDYAYKFDGDVIIRWGNSSWVYTRDGSRTAEFKTVINSAKAIKQNCKKAEATKLMAQVVNVPTLWEKAVPKGALAVVRPMEHSAGSGFSVQEGPFKVERGTYATRFLKTDAEYRVWFCGDRTMCGRRVKLQVNPEQKYPCRSNWGYEFCDGIALELHHQTLMAAKKIGLEAGAADVLYYKKKWHFLELNSAASVDHRQVREFYQAALEALIKKKEQETVEADKAVKADKAAEAAKAAQSSSPAQSQPAPAAPVESQLPPVVVPPVSAPALVEPLPAAPVSMTPVAESAVVVVGETGNTTGVTTTDESLFEFTINPIEQTLVLS
jgi:hypothetical protein